MTPNRRTAGERIPSSTAAGALAGSYREPAVGELRIVPDVLAGCWRSNPTVVVLALDGITWSVASGVWSQDAGGAPQYGGTRAGTLAPLAMGPTGGSQPHNNMGPYLTVNYSIALQGIFPPR